MALTEKLELLLTADPSQGISALRSISNEAEKTATKTTSSLQKIGTAALKVGVGGMGVGGFLTQMASGDIEAANQLKQAIGQVGQAQDDYKDRIDATVSSMVKFGHTDEQVSKALTTLTLAYNDTGKALDEMQLVADLAARKDISLEAAATMVAKAHGGAAKLFKEFGIQVKTNTDGTKDYDGALTELSKKLSGQAAAGAESWAGKLRMVRAEAENLISGFGQNFGPMILGISTLMTGFGGTVTAVTGVMGKLKAAHAANAVAAEAQAVATAEAAAAEVGLATNSAAAVASLYAQEAAAFSLTAALRAALAMAPALGAGLGGMRKVSDDQLGLPKLDEQIDKITKKSGPELQQYLHGLVISTSTDAEQAKKEWDDWFRSLAEKSPEAAKKVRDSFAAQGQDVSGLDTVLQGVAATTGKAKTETEGLTGAVDDNNAAMKDGKTLAEEREKVFAAIGKASDGAAKLTDDLSAAMGRQYDAMVEPTRLASDYAQAIDDLADRFKTDAADIGDASRGLESANFRVADSQSAVADAANELDKMRREGKSTPKELRDQERKLKEALLAVRDAQANVTDAQEKLNEVQQEGKFTLDLSTEAGRKNVAAALATGDSIKALIQHRFDETHSQEDAMAAGDMYVENLKGQMRQAGLTEEQVDEMIRTMGLTKEQIHTTFSSNAVEQQLVVGKYLTMLDEIPQPLQTEIETLINEGKYDEANMRLAALAAPRTMLIDSKVIPAGVGLSQLQGMTDAELYALGLSREDVSPGTTHRQAGGPGRPGSTYFIEPGTHGEFFTPGQSGWFTPMDKLGKGGGYTVNIGNIVTADPQDAGDQVARRLRIEAMLSTP